MEKLKTREEVAENDKWSIELIYRNIDEFNTDYKKLESMLPELEKKLDGFLENSKNFKDFFLYLSKCSRILEKLYVFASCKKDEDTASATYQELKDRMILLYTKYSEITSSVDPRILKEDEKTIMSYLDSYKELEPFRHGIESLLRQKKHTLSEKEEKIIASFTPVFDNSQNTYSYLTNADMKFDSIKNEDGKLVELTESNFSNFISSKNRDVRRDSFKSLYKSYSDHKNSITSLYSSILNYDAINSKLRGYHSSIESYLDRNNISVKLYENLIKSVRSNLTNLHKYFDLKRKMLGLKEFHLYDGYVNVIKSNDKKYSYEEAKEIILDCFKIYGEEYHNKLEEAFNNRWIDKYPNKNKRSGAYSTGSYDTIPYVLLNYTEEYDDVSTLAHELGHSMHTYFSNKNQDYENSGYPIFLAEIASTTNELILNDYMYKRATTDEECLALLNEKLDMFKGTLYRQTMFAEFEKNAHDYVDNGGVVTNEYLNNMYYELNKDYFGDKVVIDDDIKYEWLRIPHFYTPFYVYQYATSISISCYVATNILNNVEDFKEKYLELLKSGGRDYPLELLKIIDINLDDTKVFDSANKMFNETLEEFSKVYKK